MIIEASYVFPSTKHTALKEFRDIFLDPLDKLIFPFQVMRYVASFLRPNGKRSYPETIASIAVSFGCAPTGNIGGVVAILVNIVGIRFGETNWPNVIRKFDNWSRQLYHGYVKISLVVLGMKKNLSNLKYFWGYSVHV